MLNIETIFKDRFFNENIEIKKPITVTKASANISKLPKLDFDDHFYDERFNHYAMSLFSESEDIDTYTREDEIGLFKSYKIGNIYADKFNNSYKITRRNDNTITYLLNSELAKFKQREITITRKEFLEKMQYNESYKQEWYASRYLVD